ncbi:MAG: 16S rRNA (uracil(1498)-N(3))-methyltransferase [Brachymonas sp.]|nr:16S rRNA (uracil(1498)-N(3))-methyltransferase [Brachymonas sp.]
MPPRLYCPLLLQTGAEIALPAHAAKHAQVLRLQPGDAIELFHGGLPADGGALAAAAPWTSSSAALPKMPNADTASVVAAAETVDARAGTVACTTGWFDAVITRMGRNEVSARIGQWHQPSLPLHANVHIACGVPANERMDWLVEKATELGVAGIQPLLTRRSVLRLSGERAAKRVAHWQAVAIAACEQSVRTAVPWVRPLLALEDFLRQQGSESALGATALEAASAGGAAASPQAARWLLSLQADAQPLALAARALGRAAAGDEAATPAVWLLSGPEGGLEAAEEALAMQQGWQPVSLGGYTLRAETAPVAALAVLSMGRL